MKKSLLNSFKILFLFISISIINSCDKDDEPQEVTNNSGINTGNTASSNEVNRLEKVLTSNTITTNLSITVVNEDNLPINNASLQIENTTSLTNENGYALIENIEVNEHFQVIKTQSSGYVTSIKTITPSNNGITNISITLLQPTFEESFDAIEGGTISNNEVSIEFPSDAIANQNGDLYEGDVNATVTYYDPNTTSFSATIPGTLVGLDDNDSLQALISKGMIKVDLTDSSGNELEIFEGKEATITLPANDNDPETIDFWHLNEEKGIWVQTGTATKIGNEYIARVTHFSTYNLDVKVPAIDIDFVIKDADGNFIANEEAEITATLDGETYNRKITTDNNGAFTIINAPQSAEYAISFFKCEETSTVSAGVISESTTKELTADVLNNARFIQLEGILYGCDNEVLTNKAFVIEIENNGITDRITTYANASGVYGTTSWLCNYDTSTTYQAQIRVFDGDNDILTNTELTFDSNNIFKNIIVCNGTIEPVAERVYEGDLEVNSDVEFDAFIATKYNKITGNLTITNITATDLTGLESLFVVENALFINNNDNLSNLKGLENLTKVDSYLNINSNDNLINLEGIDKLIDTDIYLYSNKNLTSLKGIENLEITDDFASSFSLRIRSCDALTDITALNKFNKFGSIELGNNDMLQDLSGLESVVEISSLSIYNNELLSSLNGLESLTYSSQIEITYNNALTNFCGLNLESIINITSSLVFVDYYNDTTQTVKSVTIEDFDADEDLLFIENNPQYHLSNISILHGFVTYGNRHNPSRQDLLDGNCSQ